jgi:hypothetical protein
MKSLLSSIVLIIIIVLVSSSCIFFTDAHDQQQFDGIITLADVPQILRGITAEDFKKYPAVRAAGADACTLSSLNLIEEFLTFSTLDNMTAHCNLWPVMGPCVPDIIAVLGASSPKIANQLRQLLAMYQAICVTDSQGIPCANVSDTMMFHDRCYSQTAQDTNNCVTNSKYCALSASGDHCVPRATQQYFNAFCTECYQIIRDASLNYFKFLSNKSNSASSSAAAPSGSGSWTWAPPSTSNAPSGENRSTVSPNFGIIMTEAGFAAADSRKSAICDTLSVECNINTGLIRIPGTSEKYEHALTHLLFDFSRGSANFLTSNPANPIQSLADKICNTTDGNSFNLRCLRRFVVSFLSSSNVLNAFLQQSCLDNRKESTSICDLEASVLKFRLSDWMGQSSSYPQLCGQNGYSGAAKAAGYCLGVPAATAFDPTTQNCVNQVFHRSAITSECLTSVKNTLSTWGCCIQLFDPQDPDLNNQVWGFIDNYTWANVINKGISGCQHLPPPNTYLANFGLKFKHIAYSDLANNASLFAQVKAAVESDFSAYTGITMDSFRSITLQQVAPSAEFSSESVGATGDLAGVLITTAFVSQQESNSVAFTFGQWTTLTAPPSPQLDTVFVQAGLQQPGSSSVAEYAVPPAPGQSTPAPTTTTKGADTNSPAHNKNDNPSPSTNDTGVIVGCSIGGIVILLIIGLFMGKKYKETRDREKDYGGDTASEGSYLRVA